MPMKPWSAGPWTVGASRTTLARTPCAAKPRHARSPFDGEADLRAALMQAVAEAPSGLQPLETLLRAFRRAGRILEDNRPFSEPRLAIIAATPALRERELAKHASLIDAVAEALRQRDVPERLAGLAARTGWAAFQHAAEAWIEDPSQSLEAHLRHAFDDLHALSASATGGSAARAGTRAD
jgi:hypothetical protein